MWANELEGRLIENVQLEEQKEKKYKGKIEPKPPRGHKHTKICRKGVPEGEKGAERILEEILAENLLNYLNLYIQEAQQTK